MSDDYRFLDPWTLLLPQEGPCVLAVAGSGGKTTLVRRLVEHFRADGRTVALSQTVPHPPPVDVVSCRADDAAAAGVVGERGVVHLGDPPGPDGLSPGLDPGGLDDAWRACGAEVLLVESHARTGTPLRRDGVRAVWPRGCDRAFLVAHLAAVGRPVSARTVAGRDAPPRDPGEEPARIATLDVVEQFTAADGLLADLPRTGLPIPFLTGFGSFRDMDGMFALVSALWEHPRVRAVCLGELLGDERRDAADRRDLPPGAPDPTAQERVYALYPAHLDDA